ncbi:GNAT family N-acetyltransferase [Cryobacterium arcticum]|uniref:GNAT family N-acetyltransferase n=2 Tax=Cryobacterium arcticum TaxID=670052 RepID=A0A318A092_9MICO|nr:GNAT family N-acetyltransferase [Cryobacterium arcticum]
MTPRDRGELIEFLRNVDLTLSGLDSPTVRLWIERDAESGAIVASTGFECSDDGSQVLIRSVAVDPTRRNRGTGVALAGFVLDRAAECGADQAWLFSRRSGEFWQRLGFTPATTEDLAEALPSTHQVRYFAGTGQLAREVAWSRPLR